MAHELLIAKFRLKLKKIGKTTGPFMYDLNQIPYNYIVEMMNRFKELDLLDRGKGERERYTQLNAEFLKIVERQEGLLK